MTRTIDDIREAFDLGYSVDRNDVRSLLDEADRLANLCRDYKERAEKAEGALVRRDAAPDLERCKSEGADVLRVFAYELVERECRERGIQRLHITEHVCTAIRPSADGREIAPMPTLMGAVDLLGKP
jgi:hypothetical protein